jgi:putative hemolysin
MNDLAIVLITLIFSAFFSGMEIAFISSNKLKIELDKNKGLFSAKILAHFVKNPSRIIGTLLLGNNIALVIFGISMARILEGPITGFLGPALDSETLVLVIQTLIATFIILIAAEFIPKVFFRLRSNSILTLFAVPLNFFYWVFYPVISAVVGFSELLISRIMGNRSHSTSYTFSPIDLDHYIRELVPASQEEIPVKKEIQMLQNAMGFKRVKLRECMEPRTEITAIELHESIVDLKELFVNSGHSKILIYQDHFDNIIGFVHSSDMFNNPTDIASILRTLPIFPETMLAHNVLTTFIKEHKSIAVVVDEFGGTSGVVTMEDIIEEILGEIDDEYDVDALTEEKLSDTSFLFSARQEIDYLNEKYNLNLPESEDYETLGGLIIKIHESIPSSNEVIVFEAYKFIIREATDTRIEKVELIIQRNSY